MWPLLGVGQLVGLEGAGYSEGLGAMLTCMGLLPSMDSGVCPEVTSLSAGIVTHLAPEWFLACVCPHMHLEVTSCSAGIVTDLTFVWLHPGMDVFVRLEGTSCSAGVVADLTFVRLSPEWMYLCLFSLPAVVQE